MDHFEKLARAEYEILVSKDTEPPVNVLRTMTDEAYRKYGTTIYPEPGETCAVSVPQLTKVSALFFDRVWMPPTSEAFQLARKVAFYTATPREVFIAWARLFELASVPFSLATVRDKLENQQLAVKDLEHFGVKHIYESALAGSGVEATCIYDTLKTQNEEFKEGSAEALACILSHIDTIDPEKLDWEQVLEIRRDSDAINNLRRFRRWLDADMKGESLSSITDEICIRINDYQHAVKKHGLQTTVGALRSLLDSEFIKVAGGAGVVTTLMAGGLAGAGATLALGLGKVAIEVAQRTLDSDHLKRTTNPEIAYVIELEKRLR